LELTLTNELYFFSSSLLNRNPKASNAGTFLATKQMIAKIGIDNTIPNDTTNKIAQDH
jgi:hypothetical protein